MKLVTTRSIFPDPTSRGNKNMFDLVPVKSIKTYLDEDRPVEITNLHCGYKVRTCPACGQVITG